jgi:hypothetical protein
VAPYNVASVFLKTATFAGGGNRASTTALLLLAQFTASGLHRPFSAD